MATLANQLGARAYVRVDLHLGGWGGGEPPNPLKDCTFGKKVRLYPANQRREKETEGQTQLITIRSDILDFVSRLPDDSVCVTINAVDYVMVDSPLYHQALASEIKRVVAKDGIAFGIQSDSLDKIRNGTVHRAYLYDKSNTLPSA